MQEIEAVFVIEILVVSAVGDAMSLITLREVLLIAVLKGTGGFIMGILARPDCSQALVMTERQ